MKHWTDYVDIALREYEDIVDRKVTPEEYMAVNYSIRELVSKCVLVPAQDYNTNEEGDYKCHP